MRRLPTASFNHKGLRLLSERGGDSGKLAAKIIVGVRDSVGDVEPKSCVKTALPTHQPAKLRGRGATTMCNTADPGCNVTGRRARHCLAQAAVRAFSKEPPAMSAAASNHAERTTNKNTIANHWAQERLQAQMWQTCRKKGTARNAPGASEPILTATRDQVALHCKSAP